MPLSATFIFEKKVFDCLFLIKSFFVSVVIFLRGPGFKEKATWHEFYSLPHALSVGVKLTRSMVH